MAIRTRTSVTSYPGAITEIENPFTCAAKATIQALALELMSDVVSAPSVIIGGKIYTEASEAEIDNGICNPV